jgi:hypothetical protein
MRVNYLASVPAPSVASGAARRIPPCGDTETFSLKGRSQKSSTPIQCPAVTARSSGRLVSLAHWMRLVRFCQRFDIPWIRLLVK